MKVIKILGVLLIIVVVAVVGAFFYLNSYVHSAEFRQKLERTGRDALNTDVKINDIKFSLFSGVTLRGVAIANPQGFAGSLLTANEFVLRYRLMALLSKRLEVTQLSLGKPVVTLNKNEKGDWNYDVLFPQKTDTKPATAQPAPATSKPVTAPLDIELARVAMTEGEILLLKADQKPLAKIQGLEITTSAKISGDQFSGRGDARIATISAADMLFIRQIAAPLSIATDEVKLAPLSGKLANGAVSGAITLKLTGGFKYLLDLKVANADVDTLLQEAAVSKRVISGRLQVDAQIEGSGGLPTMKGGGQLQILDGMLIKMPAQDLIAMVLQVPELKHLEFQECRVEFTIADNVMQTPVISLKSPHIQVTGKGSVGLEDYALNHELTLAIDKSLLDKVPKEVRAIFKERADGYLTIDFKVWGPYDKPKTDLTERLVKGAVGGLLERFLK